MFTMATNLGYSCYITEKIGTEAKKRGITLNTVDTIACIAFAIIAFLGWSGVLPVSIGLIFTVLATTQVIAWALLHQNRLGLEGKVVKILESKVKE